MTDKHPDPQQNLKQNPIPGIIARALNSNVVPQHLNGRETLPVQMTTLELDALAGPDHPFADEPRVPHDNIWISSLNGYLSRPCYMVHDRCRQCKTYTLHAIDGTCHNHNTNQKPPEPSEA